jgi:hypothetical protein
VKLYDSIDLAHKFTGGPGSVVEAAQAQQAQGPDKTALALDVAKHLSESKPQEDKPIQLGSLPLPN